MVAGLVYFRPKHVVYVRAMGPFRESAPLAWKNILGWMDEVGIRGEVKCGYGIARGEADGDGVGGQRYEACIELPPSIDCADRADMRFQSLPGGAYVRNKYVGSLGGIGDALRDMRRTKILEHGLCEDRTRPLVEIYLNDPKDVGPDKLRVDLCMPVAVSTMAVRAA